MNPFVCWVWLVSALGAGAAGDVEEHRWQHRLLVLPRADPRLAAEIAERREEMAERDLVVYLLEGAPDEEGVARGRLARQLRERLAPREDLAEVFFLGKDGRSVIRWPADGFELDALFARIDSMPMRLREMAEPARESPLENGETK